MSEGITPRPGLTRRSFLKTTGALAGVAAVGTAVTPNLQALAEDENTQNGASTSDQIFYGQCRGNCQSGCPLVIKVRDGKVVHTQPTPFANPAYDRLCAKGYGHPQRTYSPKRVQYPMRVVGERGSGQWERITWDEAIEEICSKWKQFQKESGDTSVVFMPGSGAGCTGKNIGTYNVLKAHMGASATLNANDVAGMLACEKIIGMGDAFYGNSAVNHAQAKTIMIIGANPIIAHPNTFHFLQDAREKGAQLIHVDPVYSITSANCDKFVPIRPGTDTALLLGMINYVIQSNWIDESYLLSSTVAPFLVKKSDSKFLRASDLGKAPQEGPINKQTGKPAKIDPIIVWDEESSSYAEEGSAAKPALVGTFEVGGFEVSTAYSLLVASVEEWTLEKSSELCDIPIDTIKELTENLVQNTPAEIYTCYGLSQYNGGHRPYHAALTLLAVTGNFGKPGAGIGGLEGSGGGAIFANPAASAKGDKPAGPTFSSVMFPRVLEEGKIGNKEITPRALFLYGNNPIAQTVNRLKEIEAFRKMDFVVVADMWLTDTVHHCADIVLPVCGWMEQLDVINGIATPHIRLQEKAIEPLFESKNDFDIVKLLLEGMGFADKFPYTQEEYLSTYLDNPASKSLGYSWDKLKKDKTIFFGEVIHGKNGVFPTKTKKLEFYVEDWSRSPVWEGLDFGDEIDKSELHLAQFETPHEAWPETVGGYDKNPLADKYPLVYTSIRNRFTTHSMHSDVDWFKEVVPVPTMRLNPKDAEVRSIKTGDLVRAFNDRGEVVLKAEVNAGIRAGMVVYPKGWQYDDFVKGHVSDLTSNFVHKAAYNKYYFDTLCQVEKYERGE